jgi:YggT family protein
MSVLITAAIRPDIAHYVGDLFSVYIALLLIYLIANLVLSFGARPAYSRTLDAVLGFLREVSEPFLRIFRRFIPSMGGIDLSPILALIVLYVVRDIVVKLIGG